jgi:hypothetical protein
MKRTPIKRTAWLRAAPTTAQRARDRAPRREPRDADRVRATPTAAPGAFRAPQPIAATPAAAPKDAPIRSKAYLRLVAQLPCMHCGIWGFSQAAHANSGKGMAMKACDLQTFPLCADRPGQRGCHSLFDQGALFGKEARRLIEQAWVADTQRQIHAMGIWPKKYPFPLAALDTKAQAAINSGVNYESRN